MKELPPFLSFPHKGGRDPKINHLPEKSLSGKLIILDRDGVINYDSDAYIKSPEEWIPIPGSLEAIAKLNQAGFKIAVATNQSGVGRGLLTETTLMAIHEKMEQALAKEGGHIDAIFYCPHTPDDQCSCRKPKPGLFYAIANHFNCSLANVPAIGDSLRDVEAALQAGCKPILVQTGKTIDEAIIHQYSLLTFPDLAAAVKEILIKTDL